MSYCLSLRGVTETYPFEEGLPVMKVVAKMFAIISPKHTPIRISLKCDPDLAIDLRRKYTSITAGYHLNKRHWNTVVLDGTVPKDVLKDMIEHSYKLVFKGLKKSEREEIENS